MKILSKPYLLLVLSRYEIWVNFGFEDKEFRDWVTLLKITLSMTLYVVVCRKLRWPSLQDRARRTVINDVGTDRSRIVKLYQKDLLLLAKKIFLLHVEKFHELIVIGKQK